MKKYVRLMIHQLIGFYRTPLGDQGKKDVIFQCIRPTKTWSICLLRFYRGGCTRDWVPDVELLNGEEGTGVHHHFQPSFPDVLRELSTSEGQSSTNSFL
jgi:hypothetical protein